MSGHLGTLQLSYLDEFSEKLQITFDPTPPRFGKQCCAFFREVLKSEEEKNSDWSDPPFPKIHRYFPFKLPQKSSTKYFGSEMTPWKFSENSSKSDNPTVE